MSKSKEDVRGKFTPGPWGLYGSTEPTMGLLEAREGLTIGSVTHTEPIARVFGYLHDAKANARLIALCPEMYEHIKKSIIKGCDCPGCKRHRAFLSKIDKGAK